MTQERDPAEFVRMLMSIQRKLYAFVRSQVSTREDADEIVQQTTTVLWEKFGQFRPNADFGRWACGVARLEVLTHFRNRKRLRLLFNPDVADGVADELEGLAESVDARVDALTECLKHLSSAQRDLLTRRYDQDMSISHIAECADRSESSIYKSLSTIRNLLYSCIHRKMST